MADEKKAQLLIGQCLRAAREKQHLTLEEAAANAGISYQYLSGVENGKENFSIGVLESLCSALNAPLHEIVRLALDPCASTPAPLVHSEHFRRGVPLPEGLNLDQLKAAMNQTQFVVHRINLNLIAELGKPLQDYVQSNSFSGMVSNIFADALNDHSPFKHNHDQRYPDLMYKKGNQNRGVGLEIKATIKIGKGGESHNGHGGWHVVVVFQFDNQMKDIYFVHVMLAELIGHLHDDSDWKYVGSKPNEETGSQRTETYITNLAGTTKLRDGSVFLDDSRINFRRWKQKRSEGESIPSWSIFHST